MTAREIFSSENSHRVLPLAATTNWFEDGSIPEKVRETPDPHPRSRRATSTKGPASRKVLTRTKSM